MKLYVPLELQWTSRNLSYYHREFNSVRAVRGNARLLSRHCRAIGPHLALKGGISRFLELQWEAYGSSRLATGTSGNRLCCFREVKAPFKLRAVTLECSRVTAEEWDLMSHWEVIWWCFLLCGIKLWVPLELRRTSRNLS